MAGSMAQANQGAMQGWGQIGQLGVQKYNSDVNAFEAQQRANAAGSAGWGSALGTIAGAAICKYSDRRMKKDIKLIGKLERAKPISKAPGTVTS